MVEHTEVNIYDEWFYDYHTTGALRSARVILPLVMAHLPVRSAVDVGCGCGAWLRALEELGVTDVAGYDGDYVDRLRLLTNPAKFTAVDLRDSFEIGRTFDLAISLEVAEHLPTESAEPFVERLVTAAPFVLFSAAIPEQGGIHHVNEQWQDYWRSIFKSYGFYPVDLVRPAIWGHPDVEFWYQQNTIPYFSDQVLRNTSALKPVPDEVSLNMVHPNVYLQEVREVRKYQKQLKELELHLKKVLKLLPSLAWSAAVRRIKGTRLGPGGAFVSSQSEVRVKSE